MQGAGEAGGTGQKVQGKEGRDGGGGEGGRRLLMKGQALRECGRREFSGRMTTIGATLND